MNWRTKSRVIGAVERMPFSATIYYLLQRFVTRSVPRPGSSIEQVIAHERRHLESFSLHTGRSTPRMVFEFGAGWDLCGAVVRAGLGVGHQRMVDLHRLASTSQINHVIKWLNLHGRLAKPLPTVTDVDGGLTSANGIQYTAPFDARDTGYEADSVDLIVSTNTLEHIPENDIHLILRECRRILSPDGIMSMKIDYSDHYSHADSAIGPYNFLQFSSEEWRRYDHDNHYQNRLRHCDFRRLFIEEGFTILNEEAALPERPAVGLPPLDQSFQQYAEADLLPTEGYFALKRG